MKENDRIELSPHLDLWMRGARYGNVVAIRQERVAGSLRDVATVKLDLVKKLQKVWVENLKSIKTSHYGHCEGSPCVCSLREVGRVEP
jgi:hypothetical protein